MKKVFIIFILIFICLSSNSYSELNYKYSIPLGYMIATTAHELGHIAAASYSGAENLKVNYGKYLTTSVECDIDTNKTPVFIIGGEVGADLCFEMIFNMYSHKETKLNKSILFFAGTDFLRYCLYDFTINKNHKTSDPTLLYESTGIHRETIFTISLVKAGLNLYRFKTKNKNLIPYFSYDRDYIKFNIAYIF